ncbi:MAG TPA: hypothetical protein VF625_14930 [Longimicrobium sp.]
MPALARGGRAPTLITLRRCDGTGLAERPAVPRARRRASMEVRGSRVGGT